MSLIIAVLALGAMASDASASALQEAIYEGPIYTGTNWWTQRITTVHGYSGVGAEHYDLPRGYGLHISDGPTFADGIWWVYADGWGWVRADDLGFEPYIPPPPPVVVVQNTTQRPQQPAATSSPPAPVSTPIPQQIQTAGVSGGSVDDAIRTYFSDVYGWAKCVVAKESGGNPGAVSPGGTYIGLFQVDWKLHGYSPEALKDPYTNAAAARKLYNASGTSPWPITRSGC